MVHKRAMNFDDLMRVERASSPVLHPDGRHVAYVVTEHDARTNTKSSKIWVVLLGNRSKRCLTPGKGSHHSPSFSPDGRWMAFVSDREGKAQIWLLPFEEVGEARVLTTGDGGASCPVWSPDSGYIAFARNVVVSPRGNERSGAYGLVNELSTARVEDSLLYRHWDHWRELKRSHLFIVDIRDGAMEDITPGDTDSPPISLGGVRDLDFAPEGGEIAYVKNPDHVVAVSTNNSIYLQKLSGIHRKGRAKRISLTRAMDCDPRYSPDGRFISYLGARRPGYESDRKRIRLYERSTGRTTGLLTGFDRDPGSPVWSTDSRKIYFTAPDRGYRSLYVVNAGSGKVLQLTRKRSNMAFIPHPSGEFVVLRDSFTSPADLYLLKIPEGSAPDTGVGPYSRGRYRESVRRLSGYGSWLSKELDIPRPREFWYKGVGGHPIRGVLFEPPGFTPSGRYPMLLIVHGGPQSSFFDSFHYRWNPYMFAAGGYVVVQLDPRGSVGYTQEFSDQISGDWGGRCFEDLMMGVDHCLKRFSFIDGEHIGAAGASFGGFMMNWFEGNTDRFNVLISHDGIFNAESMGYMTEELWFERWEHGGMPYENRESFLRFSPHMHVKDFGTPMLVIQGEQDFRCPVSEGLSLFTALQVKKVPSRLLYFPDEGHWVEKPANSQVWYHTILDFIGRYI